MPYTPPSSRSPVASNPGTPPLSRSHSYSHSPQHNDSALKPTRPELPPPSSSYLHKHRRSPSITKMTATASETAPATAAAPKPESTDRPKEPVKPSLADSARPQAPNRPVIVTDITNSPESPQTSSDEEPRTKRGRVRELENLAELQAAIRTIEQHRVSSPDRKSEETKQARTTLDPDDELPETVARDGCTRPEASARLPLSAAARKISHSRSNTEPRAFLDLNGPNSDSPVRSSPESDVDDVEDDELRIRPTMVRKKSGELVRPALRPASAKRRPSSMPGTPTYSKAVHFDPRLEHVRHFLQVDRPLAVSAGSSPVESTFDDDSEFPFGTEGARPKSPPFEWEIRLTNFPVVSPERNSMPVRVERVYLSSDNKNLMGAIVAKNMAFHKLVVARFTLDYWKTTSEVVADYSSDIRQKRVNDCDRFLFSIKLEDQAHLENKTLFFCVRYNVNGQEYWDNNNSINYQVDFSKKARPQNGKNGMPGNTGRPLNALSRNKSSSTFLPRTHDTNASRDDFASGSSTYDFFSFPQPSSVVVEDSPIRFRNAKPARDIVSDASGRRANPAGQAFGNRYDFGAALSAAIQAAGPTVGGSPTRDDAKSAPAKPMSFGFRHPTTTPAVKSALPNGTAREHAEMEKTSGVGKPSNEFLDKYCFVRSPCARNV